MGAPQVLWNHIALARGNHQLTAVNDRYRHASYNDICMTTMLVQDKGLPNRFGSAHLFNINVQRFSFVALEKPNY